MNHQFSLDNKIALVTGCSRGIGKAMAISLAKAGAKILGVSATLSDFGSDVEKEIKAFGGDFKAYPFDFSKRSELYKLVDRIKEEQGVLDILINNAGTIQRAAAAIHSDTIWDEVVEVNQTAPFILTREFGKEMVKKGTGKIVFTASILSFQGGITVPSYAASKGAITQITKAFSNEWASKGVNVNAIAPGYVETDITAALRNDLDRSQEILNRIPAGRWGKPSDFGGPVVFLCSSAADYVHGSVLTVDGGWMGR